MASNGFETTATENTPEFAVAMIPLELILAVGVVGAILGGHQLMRFWARIRRDAGHVMGRRG